MEIEVKDSPAKHRFETTVEGQTAFIDNELWPGVKTVLHAEVPKELEGWGIYRRGHDQVCAGAHCRQ